jgi:hypothetical protein
VTRWEALGDITPGDGGDQPRSAGLGCGTRRRGTSGGRLKDRSLATAEEDLGGAEYCFSRYACRHRGGLRAELSPTTLPGSGGARPHPALARLARHYIRKSFNTAMRRRLSESRPLHGRKEWPPPNYLPDVLVRPGASASPPAYIFTRPLWHPDGYCGSWTCAATTCIASAGASGGARALRPKRRRGRFDERVISARRRPPGSRACLRRQIEVVADRYNGGR